MSTLRVLIRLGPVDLKNIRRDSLLMWVPIIPFLLVLLLRWGLEPLTEMIELQAGRDLVPWYPLIMSSFAVMLPAMIGTIVGFLLLDARGEELEPGGVALHQLDRIDAVAALPALRRSRFVGATDVTNPLCGPQGASAVYGPQKGADAPAIEALDAALAHFASVIKRDLGVDVADRTGAGAAGGLGAGLIAFLGAELVRGAQVVARAANLPGRVRQADLVITGEGRLDAQTAFGKTPRYVAEVAAAAGRPVVCLAGHLGEGHETSSGLFDEIEVLSEGEGPLPSRAEAAEQIGAASARAVGRLLGRGALAQPR